MTAPRPSLAAAIADRYIVERALGQGGMATVYLAEDLKHHRRVAIKVLKPELAAVVGPERFLREIEIAAGLRHPHILPLYDSGDAAGFLYYVMPYVQGESLRDRLNRERQLPLDDALRTAREVADALSYAHSRGVIHRDIKPENIMIESGHAVVADFGIARAVSAAGGTRLTATGMAVGTPAYMSPEQAAGDSALDGRSDLYALGCVLYEMLAGQPPFTGPTVESLIHQHLTAEPPSVTGIRPAVPTEIAGVLQRALAKNPADRFNPVAQFSEALSTTRAGPVGARAATGARVAAAVIVVGTLAMIVALAVILTRGDSTVAVGRTIQVTRDPGLEVDPAISPDGALVAYAAGPPTRMQIFVRQVSGGRVIALTSDSSRNHRWPRWSPDGARIAYQTDDGIDVVPALGGQPQPIVRLEPPPGDWRTGGFARLSGFAWSPDGSRIAYANSFVEATLTIVRIDGGEPADLALARGDGEAAWAGIHSPAWSRDGGRLAVVSDNPIFVFGGVYFGNEGSSSIWIVPVNGEPPVRVTDDPYLNTSPQWAPDGRHLYWVSDRGGSRDVYRARVSRAGSLASDPVRVTTGADAHTITLSPDGTRLAYASFRTHSNVWAVPLPSAAPISGDAARAVTSGVQTIESVDVTADGERLVFDSDRDGNFEIYTMPVGASEPTQRTTDPAGDYGPAWSPDGSHIAFHSLRHGTRDVFTMRADGSGLTRRTEGPSHQLDVDWSPDGGALVFEVLTWDLHLGHFAALTLGSGASRTLDVVGDFARWSPAGDLVAFHGPDGLRVISPSGGESRLIVPITEEYGEPFYSAWARDGRTLYYLSKGDRGASIHAVSTAGGAARLLVRFDDPSRQPTRYGFTTDGRRFYLTMGSHESDVWVAELETR